MNSAFSRSTLPPEYSEWLDALKSQIRQAQGRAALTANAEMIQLYWRIGREILAKQAAAGWGKRVIDRLAEEAIWQQRAAKLEPRRHRRGFSFRLFELSCWNLPLHRSSEAPQTWSWTGVNDSSLGLICSFWLATVLS